MERIPQSVALRVPLKAYLSSDHVSAATGKTIAVVISKNGAAFGNPSGGATNATEIANGWYYVDLSTTDTGTLGPLIVRGTSTGVDDVETALDVAPPHNAGFDGVPAVVAGANGGLPLGDAAGKVALQADQPVNTTKFGGTVQTARDIGLSVLVGDKTGFSLSTAGVQAVWDALTSALTTVGSIGKLLVTDLDAAVSSRSTYAGGDTSGTTTLLARLTSTRAALLDNLDAAVSGVAAGVWAVGGRTLTSFGTLVSDIATAVWGAGSRTLSAFGFFVVASNVLTAQQVANAVWDEATAGHQTAGTTGKALTDANNGGGGGGGSDPWATQLPGNYAAGTAGRILGGTPSTYVPAGAGDSSLLGR